ncbi:MAG: VWA domain-containing protein, partial [Rhizobiales bacterium]|nr:VWA domain-containing protein [Hyphomicrobiales bacterium]
MTGVPRASGHLLGFARVLRTAGFAIAPEQVVAFLQGVSLLGPRSMDDIRAAALATVGPTPDRFDDFERLFELWFFGTGMPAVAGDADEAQQVKDDGDQREPADDPEPRQERGGEVATAAEQLARRRLVTDADRLAAFAGALRGALPVRRTYRNERARSRGEPDLRRSLRMIVARDGDVPTPLLRRRRQTPRRLLVLIDISGSMKHHTRNHMQLAHAIVQGAPGAEVFTVGTRLTRITRPLRLRQADQALARVAELVEDWDGGTRIG